METLEVDNTQVRKNQIKSLKKIKKKRNNKKVKKLLQKITEAAKSGTGNLLALAVDAARERATLGEISYAMEEAFGRYNIKSQISTGIYSQEIKMDENFIKAKELSNEFNTLTGRRPRIMIVKLGQDGHDRGAKVIASAFADMGFDVDIGPMFQTPEEAAKQAAENDVHILGISSLAAGHKTLVPETINELKKINRDDILVIAGGVIPKKDYEYLFDHGVAGIFGPGTAIPESAIKILEVLIDAYR